MSAKWRRNRKQSRKVGALRVVEKSEDANVSQVFRIRNSWIKRQATPYKYRVAKTIAERGFREPEPLVDVVDASDEVTVVAQFAGFSRENITIHVKNQRLTLSANASDRKYYKSLNLPKRVIPSTLRAAYKNGVLEVKLRKVAEEKALKEVAG